MTNIKVALPKLPAPVFLAKLPGNEVTGYTAAQMQAYAQEYGALCYEAGKREQADLVKRLQAQIESALVLQDIQDEREKRAALRAQPSAQDEGVRGKETVTGALEQLEDLHGALLATDHAVAAKHLKVALEDLKQSLAQPKKTIGCIKSDWVNCPICGEPDMHQEEFDEGYKLIHCVNHGCKSNGGNHAQSTEIEDALRLGLALSTDDEDTNTFKSALRTFCKSASQTTVAKIAPVQTVNLIAQPTVKQSLMVAEVEQAHITGYVEEDGVEFVHPQYGRGAFFTYNCAKELFERPIEAQQPAQAAIPDGWKLVPIEPTVEMEDAANRVEPRHNKNIYQAMLNAAPESGEGCQILRREYRATSATVITPAIVYVCPIRDIECGNMPQFYCDTCPKKGNPS